MAWYWMLLGARQIIFDSLVAGGQLCCIGGERVHSPESGLVNAYISLAAGIVVGRGAEGVVVAEDYVQCIAKDLAIDLIEPAYYREKK